MTYPISAVSFDTIGKPNGQRMVVTKREGATADMVEATVTQFKLAKAAMSLGVFDLPNCPPAYTDVNELYDAPMVTVWGDATFLYGNEHIAISINICTESTTAQDLLDNLADLVEGLTRAKAVDVWQYLPANAQDKKLATTAQEFAEHAAQNGGLVDLVEQFPHETQAQQPTSGRDPNATSEGIVIREFDYKLVEQYESQYLKQQVTVRIGKMQHVVKTTDYGVKEFYEFTPFFGDGLSKYPPYALNQRVPDSNTDQYNYGIYTQLRELMPKAGDSVTGEFMVRFKVNPGDKRNYWNAQRVDFVHPNGKAYSIPHDADLRATEGRGIGQSPPTDDGFYGGGELTEDELNDLVSNTTEIPF